MYMYYYNQMSFFIDDPLKESDFDELVKGLQLCIEDLHKVWYITTSAV